MDSSSLDAHVSIQGPACGEPAPNLARSWDSYSDVRDDPICYPAATWGTAYSFISARITDIGLCTRLAVRLFGYVGVGYKWLAAFSRLLLYAVLLLPGFIQVIWFYFSSPRVLKSVLYGHGPRQRLDLYLPEGYLSKGQSRSPVVIFVTGGAWTIGYKAWGALLARRLSGAGCLVCCLDYRNFPQGDALQMLEDVNTGINWVVSKCHRYHGDNDNVILIGQSAGGQLAALALMRQAEQAVLQKPGLAGPSSWHPRDIKCFVGVSGAYDLEGLEQHLHQRGLYKSLFRQIMSIDGKPALEQLSPLAVARTWDAGSAAAAIMPAVLLIHGTSDKSVPHMGSKMLNGALLAAGVDSTCRLVERRTHTSFLLEGPMMGGRDVLMDLVLPIVKPKSTPQLYPSLCPTLLCLLAGWVCPF